MEMIMDAFGDCIIYKVCTLVGRKSKNRGPKTSSYGPVIDTDLHNCATPRSDPPLLFTSPHCWLADRQKYSRFNFTPRHVDASNFQHMSTAQIFYAADQLLTSQDHYVSACSFSAQTVPTTGRQLPYRVVPYSDCWKHLPVSRRSREARYVLIYCCSGGCAEGYTILTILFGLKLKFEDIELEFVDSTGLAYHMR
ncbi:hypothetical protein J6590_027613 [Homalodisca vitripennis]|nr:hypothetical protein J6590_027613 [Homalodisca vitripennis]